MQLNKHIAALCIGTFCLGVAELGIVPVLTAIANDFHVTIPQAGLYISAYAAGVCAGIVGLLAFGRNANLKTTHFSCGLPDLLREFRCFSGPERHHDARRTIRVRLSSRNFLCFKRCRL